MTVTWFVVLAGLVAMGCARGAGQDETGPGPEVVGEVPAQRSFEGVSSVDFRSLQDWVTYTDAVVVATAVTEVAYGLGDDEPEGMVSRQVDLEVDRVLWHADDAVAPERFTLTGPGWWRNTEDGTQPMKPADGPRIELGSTYVVAVLSESGPRTTEAVDDPQVQSEIARMPEAPEPRFPAFEEWTADSVVLVDDGVLRVEEGFWFDESVPPPDRPGGPPDLDGVSLDELRAQLMATEPDPAADAYALLPPRLAYAAVNADAVGESPAGPSEEYSG